VATERGILETAEVAANGVAAARRARRMRTWSKIVRMRSKYYDSVLTAR
jgi:hypothetical protein